jgi:hypothetical protein
MTERGAMKTQAVASKTCSFKEFRDYTMAVARQESSYDTCSVISFCQRLMTFPKLMSRQSSRHSR